MEATEEVVIIGAGISGLATALGLHRKGIASVILESSDSLRASGFALIVWANAWRALDALGVADSLRQTHHRLQRIVATSASSGAKTAELPFPGQGKQGDLEVRCLRRSLLLEALAKELPPEAIRYSSQVVGIEDDGFWKLLHLGNGSTIKTKVAFSAFGFTLRDYSPAFEFRTVLLGCDGVNSVVAKWLGLSKPCFAGRSAARGFALFPQGHDFKPEFLQFSGEAIRMGFLPCDDKNVYWFFTWTPTDQDQARRRRQHEDDDKNTE
ncbi:hypothetical protein KSP40_PGU016349 [Platanthera guangdongensis]|uniref:FAD-binding domain-containing protein n=1 Tax=Platanthera guangdongensis TaxID=2320717 RepID=A0ABR2MNW0_9ASPA